MKMKKIVPFLALMISMAGPLAYADGNKDKSASTGNAQPAAQSNSQSESAANEQNPCPTADTKQDNKQKAKPAPSDQEREFDKVLMGIYG
jgi:hypothetical protein